MATRTIWKFGPFWPGQKMKVMGRPISFSEQYGDIFVWCEIDPDWKFAPNTKEASDEIEWHDLMFVGTGIDYEGKYLGTIHTKASDGRPYVWHCIEIE